MPLWATIIQLLAAVVLVAVTGYYAYSARKTFQEMQKSRNYALPLISFEFDQQDVFLILRNYGPAPAFQPRITLATALSTITKPLSSLSLLSNLEIIAPGETMKTNIGTAPALLQSQESLKFPVEIEFKEWFGDYARDGSLILINRSYQYMIDISAYTDIVYSKKPEIRFI